MQQARAPSQAHVQLLRPSLHRLKTTSYFPRMASHLFKSGLAAFNFRDQGHLMVGLGLQESPGATLTGLPMNQTISMVRLRMRCITNGRTPAHHLAPGTILLLGEMSLTGDL